MRGEANRASVAWPRGGLLLLELMLLGLGIWGIVVRFDALDAHRLAGVSIIALVFYALAIAGVQAEMAHAETVGELVRLFGKLWAVVASVVVTFCGGAWFLLVGVVAITPAWLPTWIEQLLFLLAFLWFVGMLLKFYPRLAQAIEAWVVRRRGDGRGE